MKHEKLSIEQSADVKINEKEAVERMQYEVTEERMILPKTKTVVTQNGEYGEAQEQLFDGRNDK